MKTRGTLLYDYERLMVGDRAEETEKEQYERRCGHIPACIWRSDEEAPRFIGRAVRT